MNTAPALNLSLPREVYNTSDKSDRDNHANQCNSNNDAYWESRGEERPDDEEAGKEGGGEDEE
jgi:hypothetical protein